MKYLIVGSGGREHALSWALAKNGCEVFVWPGNDGMILNSTVKKLPKYWDQKQLISFCKENLIDITVFGPENYICEGWSDQWMKNHLYCFAPNQLNSQIESSKIYAKKLMKDCGILTPHYEEFKDYQQAIEFLQNDPWKTGYVLKYDGLAAGKGVIVCDMASEAISEIKRFFVENPLNLAPAPLLIEERIHGKELSAFAMSDGDDFIYLADACDYKRLNDHDMGPNTGGMGSYAPADWITDGDRSFIQNNIFKKLFQKLKSNHTPYIGFLFAGLMKTERGIEVIEFNIRMGDPETQAIMPLIDVELPNLLKACADKKVSEYKNQYHWPKNSSSLHVVKASPGYPGSHGEKIITDKSILLTNSQNHKNITVFYAGVKSDSNLGLLSSGGRVLGITTVANNRKQARDLNYQFNGKYSFNSEQMRKDIGC